MRIYAVYLFVGFFSIYAYRDWFKSLCAVIVLMAVLEHPDMPTMVMGVQGLSPWNLLLLNVLAAWVVHRRSEGLKWDMPPYLSAMLVMYMFTILVAFLRALGDRENIHWWSAGDLLSEKLINNLKWVIPGMLVFDGARTRSRMHWALWSILSVYLVLAIQVIRWMPVSTITSGEALQERSMKILLNEVGYHRVNLSAMLAGASWAVLCTRSLFKRSRQATGIVAAALIIIFGQALTGGRMGYVTWGIVGLTLCAARWRRYLPLIPLVVVVVTLFVPGVADRMLQGFGQEETNTVAGTDKSTLTAGRTIIWPYVLEDISKSPVIGYGRLSMQRIGLTQFLRDNLNEEFGHPHNAYLEWALDNGLIALLGVVIFYGIIVRHAVVLFLDTRRPLFSAVGGVCLSLVLALLVAAMGSQTFYPREGGVGMWCAMGLMLRAWVLRGQSMRTQGVMPRVN